MSDRFDEWVDHPALGDEERERLRRVHDLLLGVRPPPDAPDLEPPRVEADVVPLRRPRPLLLLAAALAVAFAGGAGWLAARDGEETAAPPPTTAATTSAATTAEPPGRGVRMRGVGEAAGAVASVELLPRSRDGDYPVRLTVSGLPAGETFEMWVVDDDGELDTRCGSFRTVRGVTETTLSVDYRMRTRDRWVIVRPGSTEPLLTT